MEFLVLDKDLKCSSSLQQHRVGNDGCNICTKSGAVVL